MVKLYLKSDDLFSLRRRKKKSPRVLVGRPKPPSFVTTKQNKKYSTKPIDLNFCPVYISNNSLGV